MSKKKFRVYVSQPQWHHGHIDTEAYTIEEVLAMLQEEAYQAERLADVEAEKLSKLEES